MHGELEEMLDKYVRVFQEPNGLPPERGRSHAITLMEGQGPVNVRPYWYPHHHKRDVGSGDYPEQH
ncbi:retrotransposon-related protein [Trifolium pratense]|uniref:Retrotransposon-related protein n=1 Tax=Trifolium pratense TaxID=57577 RepID=A0A2K3PR62_TRIPR|nr:retrotransposon-related protein [Trifolium pratense]